MNVVGKVFTVLILLMSLAFMGWSLMLYAAHPDWREAVVGPSGLDSQLRDANKEKSRLEEEKKKLETRIAEEKDRYVKRIAALEQVKSDLEKEREAHNKEIAEKETAMQKLVDDIEASHEIVKSNHAEALTVRAETKKAVEERRKLLEKVIDVNDDLLNAVVERLRLAKLGRELRAQLSKLLPMAVRVALPNHSTKPNNSH